MVVEPYIKIIAGAGAPKEPGELIRCPDTDSVRRVASEVVASIGRADAFAVWHPHSLRVGLSAGDGGYIGWASVYNEFGAYDPVMLGTSLRNLVLDWQQIMFRKSQAQVDRMRNQIDDSATADRKREQQDAVEEAVTRVMRDADKIVSSLGRSKHSRPFAVVDHTTE